MLGLCLGRSFGLQGCVLEYHEDCGDGIGFYLRTFYFVDVFKNKKCIAGFLTIGMCFCNSFGLLEYICALREL